MTVLGDLFPGLVQHVWSSTIFLLGVLAAAHLLHRRLTAGARFALVFVGLLKFAIPSAPIALLLEGRSASGTQEAIAGPMRVVGGVLAPRTVPAGPEAWPGVVVALWLVIAAALILWHALVRHRLTAQMIQTAVAPLERERRALRRAKRRVGIPGTIELARSSIAEAPAVLGIFRPLIVLPVSGCDDLSDDELESLLCHECAHVVRRDNLIGQIESLVCAVFWFHPFVWLAQHISIIERERACDEIVTEVQGANGAEIYLSALRRFCRNAIASRTPGISRMASATLKERMDHIMDYRSLKLRAPSPRGVATIAAASLSLFVVLSGVAGSRSAFADEASDSNYAIRIDATKVQEIRTVKVMVTENETQRVVAAQTLTLVPGQPARASTENLGLRTVVDVQPGRGDELAVAVTIEKDGQTLRRSRRVIQAATAPPATPSEDFTGEPIDLSLDDDDLREVIALFGRITDLDMRMDDGIEGTVSMEWQDVPWDRAFVEILREHGLIYRIEGSTIHIEEE